MKIKMFSRLTLAFTAAALCCASFSLSAAAQENTGSSGSYGVPADIIGQHLSQPADPQNTGGTTEKPAGPQETDGITEQLAEMAKVYYSMHNDYLPEYADCEKTDDGKYQIHLYDIITLDENESHTATSAWYTVDEDGKGTDDIYGTEISISYPFYGISQDAESVWRLEVVKQFEASSEYETVDPALIEACLTSLEKVKLDSVSEARTTDSDVLLIFEYPDRTFGVRFESGNLVCGSDAWNVEGYGEVMEAAGSVINADR